MNRTYHSQGFTLLEVLVAFVIAALALAVMYQIYARGSAAAALGREYAEAVAIAENKLAELGVAEPLEQTATSGSVADKYHWDLRIGDLESVPNQSIESPQPLREIELSLTWDSRGGRRELLFHTLRPAAAP